MKINETFHGFTLKNIVNSATEPVCLYEFVHDRTGLTLIWCEHDDPCLSCEISFRTPAFDDSGVFHVLEHCIMEGSSRYPVKGLMTQMGKGSVCECLNAYTYSVRTGYPFSTRNKKDFENLLRVYLSSVFFPAFLENENIFLQEAWHMEPDEEDRLSWKGVVFSEMKGDLADPDRRMNSEVIRALFPKAPGRFVSGGKPEKIVELTYEHCREVYRKYYCPANAIIVLDGRPDVEDLLQIIDGEFLKDLEPGKKISLSVAEPAPVGKVMHFPYEISKNDAGKPRMNMLCGWVISRLEKEEENTALEIMADSLTCTYDTPLCKALLPELAEDVFTWSRSENDYWIQFLEIENYAPENQDRIVQIVEEELQRIGREGVDHRYIEDTLTAREFSARVKKCSNLSKGFYYCGEIIHDWIYDLEQRPFESHEESFRILRKKLADGSFEKLFREKVTENPLKCRVILEPSLTYGEEIRQKEERLLAEKTAEGNADVLSRVKEQQRELEKWQNAVNTPRQLETLPSLELWDLEDEVEKLPTEEVRAEGVTVLLHEMDSEGIQFIHLYFLVPELSEEDISLLELMNSIIGCVPTDTRSCTELNLQDKRLTGYSNFDTLFTEKLNDPEFLEYRYKISFSADQAHVAEAAELMLDMLLNSHFEEEGTVFEILKQEKSSAWEDIIENDDMAWPRLEARYSVGGVASECCAGFAWYLWLKEQEERKDIPGLAEKFRSLRERFFRKDGMVLSITGSETGKTLETLRPLLRKIPGSSLTDVCSGDGTRTESEPFVRSHNLKPWKQLNEGIIIPGDVCSVARGSRMSVHGGCGMGSVSIARRILEDEYLWNTIREKGGAYGTGMSVMVNGDVCCWSYRDPAPVSSLARFTGCGDYLHRLAEKKQDLSGYILAEWGKHHPLRSIQKKGAVADERYFRGDTQERIEEEVRALKNVRREDLLKEAEALEAALAESSFCVIGSRKQVEACHPDVILSLV